MQPPAKKEMKNVPQPKKEIDYKYVGKKESLSETLGKFIPKEFIPTKRTNIIFGFFFLVAIVLAIIQFPYGSLLSGNVDLSITIGYPMKFLEFSLTDPEKSPLRVVGLIVDIIIYLLLAYVIDVAYGLIIRTPTRPKP